MLLKSAEIQPFDFDGLSIRDYTAAIESSSSFAHIRVLPGIHHRRARSTRSDKYYYILSGQLRLSVDNTDSILDVGDLYVIAKGQTFSYVNETEQSVELLLIHTPSFDLAAEVFEE